MRRGLICGLIVLAAAGSWVGLRAWELAPSNDQRVFELRIYTVLPGRMPAMHARFKNHTNGLLTKHSMTLIGFWTPQGEDAERKLYYLVAHKSKDAADASWGAFIQDPAWKKVREDSEKDGKIVEKVERIWLDPAEYSMMK